jgi:hypothetical protein
MKNVTMSPPTLLFVVATRVALALGVGILIAKRIPESRRRTVARALITLGALTTIPAAMSVKRQSQAARAA